MYCSIIHKKQKRKPYRSRIFRDARMKDQYSVIEIVGDDEIKREPRAKWTLLLNKSSRQNGKIHKKQWYIYTIGYWHIVDDKYEGYEDSDMGFAFIVRERIEKHFPDLKAKEIKDIYAKVWAKYDPIRRSVLELQRSM